MQTFKHKSIFDLDESAIAEGGEIKVEPIYIYIVTTKSLEKEGIYKVGQAKDVTKRLRQLNSGNNEKYYFYESEELEKPVLHVPEQWIIENKKTPDKAWYKWLSEKYGIERDKNPDYAGQERIKLPAEKIYMYLNEFFYGVKTTDVIGNTWSYTHGTEFSSKLLNMAGDLVAKLPENLFKFNGKKFVNLTDPILDMACQDGAIICKLIDRFVEVNKALRLSSSRIIDAVLSKGVVGFIPDVYYKRIRMQISRYLRDNYDYELYDFLKKRRTGNNINETFLVSMYSVRESDNDVSYKLNHLFNMKFDAIVMNPPYNNGLHEKFLSKAIDMANRYVVSVEPAAWLLSKRKNKILCEKFDKYGGEITTVNPGQYFDAHIAAIMSINFIDKGKTGKVVFNGKYYNSCSEITSYSNDDLLVEYSNIVEPLCQADNVHDHVYKMPGMKGFPSRPVQDNPDPNQYVLKLRCLYGHPGTKDFYSVITSKPYKELCGKFDKMSSRMRYDHNNKVESPELQYYVPFNTEQEVKRFWNYIRTKFVRGMMYLHKHSMHLDSGELKHIPFFDFKDPIFSGTPKQIDEKLFKKYNISIELQNKINRIIPDYYIDYGS